MVREELYCIHQIQPHCVYSKYIHREWARCVYIQRAMSGFENSLNVCRKSITVVTSQSLIWIMTAYKPAELYLSTYISHRRKRVFALLYDKNIYFENLKPYKTVNGFFTNLSVKKTRLVYVFGWNKIHSVWNNIKNIRGQTSYDMTTSCR